jgi:restriction system protein
MAEITRKRTGDLLRQLFTILLKFPEGVQAKNAVEALQNSVKLTEYESGNYEKGGLRFNKIVRFATIDCVKAGWMLKEKGIWSLTDEGRKAHSELPDGEIFYKAAVKGYQAWKDGQEKDAELPDLPDQTPQETEIAEKTIQLEQAQEDSWEEIQQHLRKMNPFQFQDTVAELLKAMSYHVSWVSPPGKDGGVDIIAYNDPLGARPPRIKVQVKRYREGGNIRAEDLRSFLALLGDEDVGIFVTTSDFTKDAEELARSQERRKITLINIKRFFDLWVEHYPKLREEGRAFMRLKPVYFLAGE